MNPAADITPVPQGPDWHLLEEVVEHVQRRLDFVRALLEAQREAPERVWPPDAAAHEARRLHEATAALVVVTSCELGSRRPR